MPRSLALAAIAWLALAVPSGAQQPTAPADSARAAPTSRADTTRRALAPPVTPPSDQARGLDAELRMALFDIASDRPLTALSRLEWLRSSQAVGEGASAGPRAREDLLFLLAESYYRLGVSDAFQSAAKELLAAQPAGRYTGVVGSQLMLDAYRHGNYTRVKQLAASTKGGDRGLTALVAGLAAYQSGDFAGARAAFSEARSAGGAYAPYAQLMDALTNLQGDTTKAAAALAALQPLTTGASGEFGDHVRVIAAELAFQLGQYDAAVTLAEGVSPTGGLAAQAQLTKAWALYRANKHDAAAAAFADYAKRFPDLPERDEARLMVGQLLLEGGHADQAESYFQSIADSLSGELTALQARTTAAMTDASRALVTARSAGIVFVGNSASGKSLSLPNDAGAERAVIVATFAERPLPTNADSSPAVVSLADVESRLAALAPTLGADFPRRMVFTAPSSDSAAAQYASRSQALLGADVSIAIARLRLDEALAAERMKLAALQNLQQVIADGNENLAYLTQQLGATQDSLVKMQAVLAEARQRVHTALADQVQETQTLADENARRLDSLRTTLGGTLDSGDAELLAMESRTAGAYRQLAAIVQQGLDAAIDRHPAFLLRDSLAARLARARALRDSTAMVLASDDQSVKAELERMQGSESDRVRSMRGALAAAESGRSAAEGAMIALLDGELRARAGMLVAMLERDRETADYGTASAAFFKAMDAAAAGPTGTEATGSTNADSAQRNASDGTTPPRR